MADALAAFLDAASTALHMLERGDLAERWRQDSVLPRYISVCLPAFAPGTVHRDDG